MKLYNNYHEPVEQGHILTISIVNQLNTRANTAETAKKLTIVPKDTGVTTNRLALLETLLVCGRRKSLGLLWFVYAHAAGETRKRGKFAKNTRRPRVSISISSSEQPKPRPLARTIEPESPPSRSTAPPPSRRFRKKTAPRSTQKHALFCKKLLPIEYPCCIRKRSVCFCS